MKQNIDDPHGKGGAAWVIYLHGALGRALCAAFGARWNAPAEMRGDDAGPAGDAGDTRPDVAWFGEIACQMDRMARALAAADLLVAFGLSGRAYPAAGLAVEMQASGAPTLGLALTAFDTAGAFDNVRLGPATEVVPASVAEVFADQPAARPGWVKG